MRRWMWMGAAAIGLCLNAVAAAQADYVSISALNNQVQEMGGVWRRTYETPDGPVIVDVPVIVPDVEQMPVITVKAAPFSEALFERIMHSEPIGRRDEIRCELELDGEVCEFFLGNIQPEDQKSGYSELPLDAQSGEWIFFTTGSEEVFSVPRMMTWEEVSQE